MYQKWEDSKIHDKNKVSVHLSIHLHFSNNDNYDKTDKSYKIRPIVEHLNKLFAEILSNSLFQSVGSTCASLKVNRVWNKM